MNLKTARKRVGVFFWTLTGLCLCMIPYGLLTDDPGFVLSGFTGGAWFTMMACMPRDWFLRIDGKS